MKVLQVLYSGLGGHGSVVTSLIEADKEKEWEHSLLFYGIEDLLPAYKVFCNNNNVPFSFIKKKKGLLNPGWRKINKELNTYDPDTIILHSPTLIFQAWLFCRFRKKKLYVVEHTPHISKGMAEKASSFFSILLARKVVCLTSAYRQELKKQFGILPVLNKTVVIPNGIDVDKFQPVDKTFRDELNVGMIGRFSRQKNQAIIIKAAKSGFSSGKLPKNIHFHFAGIGETLPAFEMKVKESNLESNIHFHGLLNEEAIKKLMAGLDIYIHASFAETMCTSVMQAMACGLPVIGSDIAGINDLVQHGENGILFKNGNPDEIVHAIIRLQDQKVREKMSLHSRKIAVENFSAAETFKNYSALIS